MMAAYRGSGSCEGGAWHNFDFTSRNKMATKISKILQKFSYVQSFHNDPSYVVSPHHDIVTNGVDNQIVYVRSGVSNA